MKFIIKVYNIRIIVVCLLWLCSLTSRAQDSAMTESVDSAPVVIYGEITPIYAEDDLTVTIHNGLEWETFAQEVKPGSLFMAGFGKGYFSFVSPEIDVPVQISVSLNQRALINNYWIFPGDSIQFQADRSKGIIFGGPAASHFKFQYDMAYRKQEEAFSRVPSYKSKDLEEFFQNPENQRAYDEAQSMYGRQTEISQSDMNGNLTQSYRFPFDESLTNLYERKDEGERYRLIFVSQYGNILRSISQEAGIRNASLIKYRQYDESKQLISDFQDFFNYTGSLLADDIWDFPKALSVHFLLGKYMQILTAKKLLDLDPKDYLSSIPSGLYRDNLIYTYISKASKSIDDITAEKAFFLPLIENENLKSKVQEFYTQLTGGDLVDLSFFNDKEMQPTNLEINKGKVQLLDFWFTGCGACVKFYKDILKPLHEEYGHREDFQIVSISNDINFELWQKSVSSDKYTHPDFINLVTLEKNHPFLKRYGITGFPYHMLIDSNLKVSKATSFPNSLEGWKELIESTLNQ